VALFNQIMKKLFPIFVLILLISSCGKQAKFVHNFEMNDKGWEKFNNLHFTQNSFVKNKAYSVNLDLVIDENYTESSFEFQLLIESEEGESWNKVFAIPIKDKEGNFLIEKKNGVFNYHILLLKAKYFNEKGNYSFEVVNLNPKLVTKGIKKISFIFEG